MDKRRIAATVFAVASILFTIFIFSNSAKVAEESAKQSGGIVETVMGFLHNRGIDITVDTLSFIVRKLAHFAEYFILGTAVGSAVYLWSGTKSKLLYSPAYCTLAAVIDEFAIQGNTAGRSAEIRDCFIDLAGSICGILFLLFIIYCAKRYKSRQNENI